MRNILSRKVRSESKKTLSFNKKQILMRIRLFKKICLINRLGNWRLTKVSWWTRKKELIYQYLKVLVKNNYLNRQVFKDRMKIQKVRILNQRVLDYRQKWSKQKPTGIRVLILFLIFSVWLRKFQRKQNRFLSSRIYLIRRFWFNQMGLNLECMKKVNCLIKIISLFLTGLKNFISIWRLVFNKKVFWE